LINLRTLSLFVLLVIAVISLLWESGPSDIPTAREPSMAERRSDYYLEGFRIVEYGKDGNAAKVLAGEVLTHYRDDDTADIVSPRLELQQPGGPRWTMQAERGWLSPGGEEIQLRGKVVMMRAALPALPALRIDTQDVSLWPDAQRVQTDAPVSIIGPHWRVSAIGLESNIGERKLTLLHQVRAHYDTPE
jgi:lipopolysaccharide export system protein LptC